MKKIILVLAVCLMGLSATFAQNKAIGLRGGYGFEISYQQPLGDANRLEADLGLQFGGINLAGVYQWVWSLESIGLPEGFKWYAGPGADIFFGLGGSNSIYSYYSGLSAGIGGQIGIEYSFANLPIQLSFDYRPMWLFGKFGYYNGYAGAIRYIF